MENEKSVSQNRQVKIHRADIPQDISAKAVTKLNEAMDKYQIEKDMATYVKKKCDEEFGGTWQCVVGRNFGCSITHDTNYITSNFKNSFLSMGGGNGLKSHMARERKNAKEASKGKGGGGKEGMKERTASAVAITCSLCKLPFQSLKMKVQLKEHWEAKHPRNTFAECFPGQTPP